MDAGTNSLQYGTQVGFMASLCIVGIYLCEGGCLSLQGTIYLLLGYLYTHFTGPQIYFVSKKLNITVPFYN